MCMATLVRRLQILLDEDRYRRLAQQAKRRGTAVATLVREAIDTAFPPVERRRAAAAREILEADPMEVPRSPAALRRELDALRGRR